MYRGKFKRCSRCRPDCEVPLDNLRPNPWNRKGFDSGALAELAASIKANGVIEALNVRPLGGSGEYEICSGNRRWLAARQAGLETVPCRIQNMDDDNVQAMNLVANIQREEISGLDKAMMVKAFMDANNLSQSQTAERLGKSEAWLAGLISFLRLPAAVQESARSKNLRYYPMQAIASLPNDAYKVQIAKELNDGTIQPEQVEKRVNELRNGYKASQAKRNKRDEKSMEVSSSAVEPTEELSDSGSLQAQEEANVHTEAKAEPKTPTFSSTLGS